MMDTKEYGLTFNFRINLGSLVGHKGWVTAVATSSENPDMILTASRDKTIMVWQLTRDEVRLFLNERTSVERLTDQD